jgi:RNA polymerase sigma factor (sigma-70 family)
MNLSDPLRADLERVLSGVNAINAAHVLEGAGDTVLLGMARGGSNVALSALYARYRPPAARYARHLGLGAEADDVVSDTFAHILDLLSRGKGPETAFRAYLFTSIRHEAGRRAKAGQRVVSTGDAEDLDQPVLFGHGELDLFERRMVRNAFDSLPERWRAVLWELDVEGRTPREVGEKRGMSPNAISALVYRARSGLRESYLQQHVGDHAPADKGCAPTRAALGAVVRGTAHKRLRERVFIHLGSCHSCHDLFMELNEVNRELGVVSTTTVVATAGAVGAAGLSKYVASWLSTVRGYAVAALVPAVAVVAVVVVPAVVENDAPSSAVATPAPTDTVVLHDVTDPRLATSQKAVVPAPSVAAPDTSRSVSASVDTGHPTALPKTVDSVVDVVQPVVAGIEPIVEAAVDTSDGMLAAAASVAR